MTRHVARRRVDRSCESLEPRRLLTSHSAMSLIDAVTANARSYVAPMALQVEPQYEVHHTPRLQPGNAPLIGTPAYTNTDQVDILWQTLTVGTGQVDWFEVH